MTSDSPDSTFCILFPSISFNSFSVSDSKFSLFYLLSLPRMSVFVFLLSFTQQENESANEPSSPAGRVTTCLILDK